MARINVYVPDDLCYEFNTLCPDLFPSQLLQAAMLAVVVRRRPVPDIDAYMAGALGYDQAAKP